jgi:hypothetical protein
MDYFAHRASVERKAAMAAKDMTSFRAHMNLANAYERRMASEFVAGRVHPAQVTIDAPLQAAVGDVPSLAQEQAQAQQNWRERRTGPVMPMPLLRN